MVLQGCAESQDLQGTLVDEHIDEPLPPLSKSDFVKLCVGPFGVWLGQQGYGAACIDGLLQVCAVQQNPSLRQQLLTKFDAIADSLAPLILANLFEVRSPPIAICRSSHCHTEPIGVIGTA